MNVDSLRLGRFALGFVFLLSACGDSGTGTPPDASPDVVADASPDVPADAAPEVGADSAMDAPADVRPDTATDTSPDVALDATPDRVAPDATAEAAVDAPADASMPGDQPTSDVATDVTGATCGTRGTGPCPAGQYCNFPASSMCGVADGPGRCDVIPRVCTRELNPVCGCDGSTYSNPCLAAAAGVSVARTGACASTDAGADVATMCAAQDARGDGLCDRFFGYAWNGASCVSISGCSCTGAACMSLFPTVDACRAAYPSCDCRSVGCRSGTNCQACRGVGGIVYACIPDGAAC